MADSDDDLPVRSSGEADPVHVRARVLYGREVALAAIAERQTPVLLLTGDSGIGKSELLRAAQERIASVCCPPPRTVRGTSGSLQRSLLEALAEATADLARERGLAREVSERLIGAGEKLLADKGKEAAKVLVRAVLLKVKEKVGEDAIDLVGDYLKELGAVEHETLFARINAATDQDVASIILDLAAEVVDLAGEDAPLILALDGAQALAEDDRRLLADLATRLPNGLFLRVGYGTYNEEQQSQVEDLLAVGEAVAEFSVRRILIDAIREWLEAEGQDPQLADEVNRHTGGYPLDVGDAVQQIASGGDLADVEPSQQFKMRSRQAWRALDASTQAVARRLAVFEQPLPGPWLRQACGLDDAEWGAALERLSRARILSTLVHGMPWFHPRRREAILEILGEDEREALEAAKAEAIRAYLEFMKAESAPQLTADIATLALRSPSAVRDDEHASAAVLLDRKQLAVAAALMDVFEPDSFMPLANDVLQHARDFFAGEGDLIPALEGLIEVGIVASEGDHEVGGLLRPNFGSETAKAVIQGRALQELGRLPLPGIVSSVFTMALAPRLRPALSAVYGLGRGTLQEFLETAEFLGRDPAFPRVRRGEGHFLTTRARFHGRPISATVRFASTEDLNAARARIEGLRLDVLGGALDVIDIIAHPGDAIAADRFLGAVERALGERVQRGGAAGLEMEAPYDLETYMGLRVAAFKLLAERCNETERRVFGLEQVPSIHWHFDASSDVLIQGEAYGGEPTSVQHVNVPVIQDDDPFAFFRYVEAFDLAEDERLLRLNESGGKPFRSEPVVQVIRELSAKARQVTRHQSLVRVPVDAVSLEASLRPARARELADARALTSGLLLKGQNLPEPQARATYVCLHQPAGRGRLAFGYIQTTSESGQEEVYVTNAPPPSFRRPEETLKRYAELFTRAVDGEFISGSMGGDAKQGVAGLLGYSPDDILLV